MAGKLLERGFPAFAHCNVCGRWAVFRFLSDNFREDGHCRYCRSFNRQRQLAFVVCSSIGGGTVFGSLGDLAVGPGFSIYNTEAYGPIHRQLSVLPGYRCSEYFGHEHRPGESVDGIRHEDVMALSFPDRSFDLVLSSDVLEHVPDPYRGHREIFRVLKPGGRHIFTVPFIQTAFRDEIRASLTPGGDVVHNLEPIFHRDPLRPEGILVFTHFGLEMLCKLADVGFTTRFHQLYSALHGIVGDNALVFEAIRPP